MQKAINIKPQQETEIHKTTALVSLSCTCLESN